VFAVVSKVPARLRFVAKQELASIPIFGRAWRACGHVSVDRSDRAAAIESLEAASRRIRDGGLSIVMFPEGTRSPTGELQRFKKGAFVLAIKAGVPVVPVAVIGSRPIMPKGSYRIRKGEIHIRVGEPIPVDGLSHEDRDSLTIRARESVAALRGGEGPTSRLPSESRT
jgi:1-acyl-sn-glycerol-3-phosphate acyltransferase